MFCYVVKEMYDFHNFLYHFYCIFLSAESLAALPQAVLILPSKELCQGCSAISKVLRNFY